jgi:hypothetical protein
MMNTVYSTLITKYPDSEQFFSYLKSAEGGKLVVRETENEPLAIILYNKKSSDMTHPLIPYFRSVIWNKQTHRPVCVAPFRNRTMTEWIPLCEANQIVMENYVVEELVDGTMLNLFWDGTQWRVATRSQLDAPHGFYSSRGFGELFWETLQTLDISLDLFQQEYTYSWVLHHPEERLVATIPYAIPQLTLVEVSKIYNNGYVEVYRTLPSSFPQALATRGPTQYSFSNPAEIEKCIPVWGTRYGSEWQGLIIKAKYGTMIPWKVRSSEYKEARKLRGNNSNLRFVWLERWSEGLLRQYLQLYPEESQAAEELVQQFKQCTQEFHNYYMEVYRNHLRPLGSVPQKYRKLLWDYHQRRTGSYFPVLRDFMNEQDTARKLWLVHFERRYPAASDSVPPPPPTTPISSA